MRYTFFAAIVPAVVFFSACATAQKPPLAELSRERRERYAAEDINGVFPDTVYIKTLTQTFNSYHYYLLRDGLIWYKSIDPARQPADWTLFGRSGLPRNTWKPGFVKTKAVVEISADADELVALSEEGLFYRYCFDPSIARNSGVWLDRSGWPEEQLLYHDRRTQENRAWAMGKRNLHVQYYEDPFGNQHHNGTMEIATTYVLLNDGQEISYADTGLPGDFSRNYLGPERGAFKALALSASASTMFLINEAGEMYTRLADFDTSGCDPMFFKYTYVPYQSSVPGTDYFSNLTEWGLPGEDWRTQPRIPLQGRAALTRHITILQNGQGNAARELRVAGLGANGETGYWTKPIFADTWEFKAVPLFFSAAALLPVSAENPGFRGERGPSRDTRLRGSWWNGDQREAGWEYEIPDFNILEGSCDFRISWEGETCVLRLHPVELWTYLRRDYLPGREGPPKMFFCTLEIPENAFDGLSAEFVRRLREKYEKNNRALFQYYVTAGAGYFFMRENNSPDGALLLTGEGVSDHYPEFRRRWYIESFAEPRRYDSPELVFVNRSSLSREDYGELRRKIELNKSFRDELRERINESNRHKFTAFTFNSTYIPLDYFSRLTFLNYLDMPKINTITRFGERIVLTNAAYIDIISNNRIRFCERIISLLEPRIHCYSEMANRIEKGAKEVPFPSWFADTVPGYWIAAGLPSRVSGQFFNPADSAAPPVPATLYFKADEPEPVLWGWYLDIGESPADGEEPVAELFIDPRKSVKTIYGRGKKSPASHPLRLDCTLYLSADSPNPETPRRADGDLVLQRLRSLLGVGGRNVRITFNGTLFEIAEYPQVHPWPLIFRGRVE